MALPAPTPYHFTPAHRDLAARLAPCFTTLVLRHDLVPRFSAAAMAGLKEELLALDYRELVKSDLLDNPVRSGTCTWLQAWEGACGVYSVGKGRMVSPAGLVLHPCVHMLTQDVHNQSELHAAAGPRV
jgi:hypothetical protein